VRSYRCYLLNIVNQIADFSVITCADDAEARRTADAILARRPEFHGVEVWELGRRVHVGLAGPGAPSRERSTSDAAD
jgi:hypothetical protein